MKKILVVICAVMILGTASFSANAESEISLTFSSQVWSKYLGSEGAICHDEPVLQNDFFISLPKGFYFDIWHSAGLDDADLSSNFGDELDFTLGWSGNWEKFGIDMGVTYVDGLPTFKIKQGDFLQPYIELNRVFDLTDSHAVTPYLKLRWLQPIDSDYTFRGGLYTHGGVKHSWQLLDKLTINQKVDFLYDSGVCGLNKGIIGQYSLDLGWDINNKVTFNPLMLKFSTPLSSVDDGRKPGVVVGVGLTVHF